jgi:hypothetical protein
VAVEVEAVVEAVVAAAAAQAVSARMSEDRHLHLQAARHTRLWSVQVAARQAQVRHRRLVQSVPLEAVTVHLSCLVMGTAGDLAAVGFLYFRATVDWEIHLQPSHHKVMTVASAAVSDYLLIGLQPLEVVAAQAQSEAQEFWVPQELEARELQATSQAARSPMQVVAVVAMESKAAQRP